MHTKTLALLLLTSAITFAEPEAEAQVELEKKQYSGDALYSSAMAQYSSEMAKLNSLYVFFTPLKRAQADRLKIPNTVNSEQVTSNYPAYSSAPFPTMSSYPDNPMTTQPPQIPQGGNQQSGFPSFEMPPPSIESVLATAIPPSFMSAIQNPKERSAIFSEMHNGHFPSGTRICLQVSSPGSLPTTRISSLMLLSRPLVLVPRFLRVRLPS